MAIIPKKDFMKDLLDNELVLQDFRPYIGMSSLHGKCLRSTWYTFRWACDRYVPKRVQRIFERGDLEEARVVGDLRAAGMEVTDCLEDQIELVDETGHIKGHPDGKVMGVPVAPKTPHALEIKTMKHSLYVGYLKKGLELSYPVYWGQIHTYMGEQNLTRALFIATNKDTEERNYERIKYDPAVHDRCMSLGMDVLTAVAPPKRIGDVTWYECKMCDNKGICHSNEPIKKTCRSCNFVDIEMEGQWRCRKHKRGLAEKAQMEACDDYQLDEAFNQ
jgi:hypothetical protein